MRQLFLLFLCINLLACTSNTLSETTSCNRNLTPVWADKGTLHQDILQLSSVTFEGRKTQTEGAALTRAYLNQRFHQIGLIPWTSLSGKQPNATNTATPDLLPFDVPFEYEASFSTRQGINVIGTLPARSASKEWRIVVAHYDHLGKKGRQIYHGADDNASGVAALLQLAQRAKTQIDQGLFPDNINLMFVATDAEEPGLYGSKALAPQLQHLMPSAIISLALNLDMVGHPSRPYAVFLEGTRQFDKFSQWQTKLSQHNGLCIKLSHPRPIGRSIQTVDWLRASDHYPFHQAGIPWLYFGVPPHPQYHTPEDTIDRIDFAFLAAVSESAFELLVLDQLELH